MSRNTYIEWTLRSSNRIGLTVGQQLEQIRDRCQCLPILDCGGLQGINAITMAEIVRARDARTFRLEAFTTAEHMIADAIIAVDHSGVGGMMSRRDVLPEQLLYVPLEIGAGCCTRPLFLAQYPGKIDLVYKTTRSTKAYPFGRTVRTRISTGLGPGWYGRGHCNTQSAKWPRYGGTQNFLTCHLAVIKMLDTCRDFGMRVTVNDTTGFWEHRSLLRLASYGDVADPAHKAMVSHLRYRFTAFQVNGGRCPEIGDLATVAIPNYENLTHTAEPVAEPPDTRPERQARRIKVKT